ncbi:MAG: glutamate mutase L [Anaerolineae bacterium]|nr:glutamate mutase L [Anaerolineae bacterium]
MEQDYRLESFLVADCGSTTTRVALIDLVGNEFRLVAQGQTATTVEVPWSRISTGVREAIRQVERSTGRILLSDQEQLIVPEREDGSGVDGLVATVNAATPLLADVVGLIRDLGVESLLAATDCSYVDVRNVVARDEGLDRTGPSTELSTGPSTPLGAGDGRGLQGFVGQVFQERPDVILLAGGTDGGATAPVLDSARDVAAVLSTSEEGGRVHVVYAGNKEMRTAVVGVLGDCSTLHVVDNVRPTLDQEDLAGAEEEIRRLYREVKVSRVPGFGELKSWAVAPVLSTAEGLGLVLKYLARVHRLDVLAVDVGSSATHLAGVLGGRYGSTVGARWGVGYSIGNVLDQAGLEGLLQWLPWALDPGEAHNRIVNKALRPMTIPEAKEDLLIEQAAARAAMALTVERARSTWLGARAPSDAKLGPRVDLVIGRGAVLTSAPHVGQAALMLLDGLQPTGVCTLALDRASLLPQLGALGSVHPVAATQTLARDGLLRLGTAICLTGTGREGSVALRLKVDYDDGRSLRVEVPYGSLEVIPLLAGKRATVEMRPSRQFDAGVGSRGRGATTQVDGGAVGIIVDARGRPLRLPSEGKSRRGKIREWMGALGF